VIPQNIIDKPPSAELRENQKDQDSLPPYPVLDDILECLVEKEMGVDADRRRAAMTATLQRRASALHRRIQAPAGAPGVKITLKNFGRDRRYPITNRFRETRVCLAVRSPRERK
jgi:NAD+ synthase